MWIGESRDYKRKIFGLKWPRRPIKCFVVYLTYAYDEFIKLNYKQRLKNMENTVSCWTGRRLTIYGRMQIINSILLPKLIYIASMFLIPEQVIKEVNRIIYKFLWRGLDRVIRSAVINDYENGVLKVFDFETLVKSLRLAWLKRLFNEEDAGWKYYLRYLLKNFQLVVFSSSMRF